MSDEQQAMQPPTPPEASQPLDEQLPPEEESPVHDDSFMRFLANFLPWVISLLFHLGVLLVMMFVVMVGAQVVGDDDEIIVPNAELSNEPGAMNPTQSNISNEKSTTVKKNPFKMKKADPGKSKTKLTEVIGATGGAASSGDMGIKAVSGGRSTFFGGGGNAYNVVYVVDRSGSMVNTFDHVRNEMIRSIGKLSPKQTFHVVFFAEGKPKQLKTRRLIYATPANKLKAVKYLQEIFPKGQTDVVPALEEAFRVLDGARKKGRLVYLLTDGDFRGKDQDVYDFLAKKNKDKKVHVNTFLYGNIGMKHAEETLKKIAKENGGQYRAVAYEE